MQRKHAKIVQPALLGCQQGGGHRGGCGFKAYAQKYYGVAGVGGGKGKGIERRINNFYPCALRLCVFEAEAAGTGHAQQVAKGGDNDAVAPCKVKKSRHFGIMGDAHRAAGARKVGYR